MKKILLGLLLIQFCGSAAWAVPQVLNFQGKLSESGSPVGGSRDMTFNLYNATTGGTAVFSEAHAGAGAVTVSAGIFNVVIGGLTPGGIPLAVFDGSDKFLEVQIGTTTLPRQRITSVGYSMMAGQAQSLAPGATIQFSIITASSITATNIFVSSVVATNVLSNSGRFSNELIIGDQSIHLTAPNGPTLGNAITFDATGGLSPQIRTGIAGMQTSAAATGALDLIINAGAGGELYLNPFSTGAVVMSTQPASNVGIGTTSPIAKLDVQGGGANFQYGISAGSATFSAGLTASSATFTQTGNTNFSLQTSSGVSVGQGVYANFFSGSFYGNGAGLTGVFAAPPTNMVTTDTTQTISGAKTLSSAAGLAVTYGLNAGSATIAAGITASSATFTQIGNANFSLQTSSGVSVGQGVYASFFVGNGSGITGISASQIPATGVQNGTLNPGVLLNAGSLTNGPVASSILPSTVAYTSASNTFTSSQTITGQDASGYSLFLSSGINMPAGTINAGLFVGNGAGLTNITATDNTKVLRAGDTMTGALNMNNSSINLTGPAGNVVSQASVTASAFFGNGSGLTGISASQVTAGNVTAGTFGPGVLINAGSVVNGPLASNILPSTVAYISVANTFSASQTITGQGPSGYSLELSSGINSTAGTINAGLFVGNGSGLTNVTAIDNTKVLKAGDSMTGALNMSNSAINLSGPTGNVISQASVTASAFFGNGAGLTGVSASQIAAANVTAGTFGPGVFLDAGSLVNGPLSSNILPSTVAYTTSGNNFTANQVMSAGLTASSGSFTQTGNFGINVTSGITVGQGVYANFFSGTYYGSGAGLTNVSASQVAAANVTAGTFGPGVFLNAGSLTSGPLASGILPSTVTYTSVPNTFTSSQTITAEDASGFSLLLSSGLNMPVGTVNAGLFVGNGSGLTNVTAIDSTKVLKVGDTMTGALNMSNATVNLTGPSGNIVSQASVTASAFFGSGAGLTGVSASQVAAANVTAGTFGSAVFLDAGSLINGPVASSILPSSVAYTSVSNNFTAHQSVSGGLTASSGTFTQTGDFGISVASGMNVGQGIYANFFVGNGSGLTNVSASQIAAGNVTPGRFVTGVNLPAANVLAGSLGAAVIASSIAANSIVSDAQVAAGANISESKISNLTSDLASRVLKAGDTMTGPLNMSGSAINLTGPLGSVVSQASVTASAFFGDGAGLTNLPAPTGTALLSSTQTFSGQNTFLNEVAVSSDMFVQGTITAGAFVGNGSGLTGVTLSGAAGGDLTGSYPNPLFNLGIPHSWIAAQTFIGGAKFPASGIWNNSGEVGIGTINPLSKLDVSGSIAAGAYAGANAAPSNGMIISGSVGIGTTAPLSKLDINGGVAVGSYAGANAAPANGLILSGNVGIGTTGPVSKLDINGGVSVGSYAGANAAPANGLIISGNVGIGTSTPATSLHIVGAITSSSLNTSNAVVYTDSSGKLLVTPQGGAGTLCLVSTSGGVPVWSSCAGSPNTAWSALTNPTANLALSMGANTSAFGWNDNSTNNLLTLNDTNGNTGTGYLFNLATFGGSRPPLRVNANGIDSLIVNASGNVGIGTTSPAANLDVYGATGINANLITSSSGSFKQVTVANNSGTGAPGLIVSQDASTPGIAVFSGPGDSTFNAAGLVLSNTSNRPSPKFFINFSRSQSFDTSAPSITYDNDSGFFEFGSDSSGSIIRASKTEYDIDNINLQRIHISAQAGQKVILIEGNTTISGSVVLTPHGRRGGVYCDNGTVLGFCTGPVLSDGSCNCQ